jgi:hypothetical protein
MTYLSFIVDCLSYYIELIYLTLYTVIMITYIAFCIADAYPTICSHCDYLPCIADAISHIGVKIPKASTNTMPATMTKSMGSIRAVNVLKS